MTAVLFVIQISVDGDVLGVSVINHATTREGLLGALDAVVRPFVELAAAKGAWCRVVRPDMWTVDVVALEQTVIGTRRYSIVDVAIS